VSVSIAFVLPGTEAAQADGSVAGRRPRRYIFELFAFDRIPADENSFALASVGASHRPEKQNVYREKSEGQRLSAQVRATA
jgi:hypothetical protein